MTRILAILAVVLPIWLGVAAGPANAQVRIMPLGDSITGSPGCWRALLWRDLETDGFTNIDFVGTLPAQGCGFPYDGENEGHGGFLAGMIVAQNLLPGWLSATQPDIVVMHLGTNDVWSGFTPAVILTAFSTLVDQMRAQNPNMKILVAQILPMNPSNCPDCGQRVIDLNAAIPSWAAGKSTAQSPIVVVDQWTGFSTATDTADGVHPIDSGNLKIAARWLPPLENLLSGAVPAPSFAVSVSPASLSVNAGATAVATVSVTRTGGFASAVGLAVTGLPAGVTAAFGPVSGAGTSALTLTAASTAAVGQVNVTITGSGGGLARTAPLALTVAPTGGGPGPVTATPNIATAGAWFNEEQVKIANSSSITAMTLTITVQITGGVTFNGQYNTVGSFTQSHASTASSIAYQYVLGAGQTLSPGTGWIFAAQSSGSGTPHPTSGDTYTLTYTADGIVHTLTGHF